MGSQGPGRKRTPSKNGLTAEEDALNVIAKEAEARLAAKRAARAEAREIRMRELERQQKEVSDDEERMSVGSRSNVRADDRLERDYLEKGSSRASTISGATLTSLGGTSSRRGSGDASISADTEASIREIKDSLLEVEEKYRKAMVSNAQLDNEKTNMMYEVDTLKDSLMELEEILFETRRELEEKYKDLEREKHAHSILQFQFSELKETLKQSEELLTKHGIVLGPDLATNGETEEEVGKADQNSQTASAEIREGSSVLGTHQLKVCKDQQQKDLDDAVPGNLQNLHAPFSSTNTPVEANENEDFGNRKNQGVEQLENKPEECPNSVGDDELTVTRPNEEIKSEVHKPEDSQDNTVELECFVHKDELLETDQQECAKPSQDIKEETSLEFASGSVHDEPDKPGETVLDDKLEKEEPVESSQTEKLAKTQSVSSSNKKKKKKKKNKQKQKASDKQENDTKIDDKNETVCNEDKLNQKMEGDQEGNHLEPLGNDRSKTTINTDVPHDAKGTSELGGIETSTNISATDDEDKILLASDETDLAGNSKTISNFDCPESSNGVLSDDLSSNVISNPANIIVEHNEDSTNPDSVTAVFSCELVSSEIKTSLLHEPTAFSIDAVKVGVESISCSENIEKPSSVESHSNCELEEQEERVQTIDPDGTINPEEQDDSAHSTSPVMEKVENEAESVILEQPIDQPMENQLQDSIGAELEKEVVERQDDLDKEILKLPTENVSDSQDRIEADLEQEEVEIQDDLNKENLNVPCEKVSEIQDGILEELDQEEAERQDDLDKEIHKLPTEKVSDTQDGILEELDKEEVERQDELDKENLIVPTENVSDGSLVDNTPLIETQVQVVHEDHLSPNEAIKESVGESDSSGQEPKVEKDEVEKLIQNQLEVQLPEDKEELLVKSDVAAQELKEEDEEEEDGESFDFDEMDLEASLDVPLKNFQDQPKEEGTLFKDDVQEAKQEYQSNVTDEVQTQEEHLELADQESKPKRQTNDEDTKNPQTTPVTEGCLTEDSKVSSEVKPSKNKEDAFEEHQQSSEDVTLSKGGNLISKMETRNVGQEVNTSIQHENKVSSISGDQEVEKETTERNKEDERKESKKSGKGKGKSKGKEECKMS